MTDIEIRKDRDKYSDSEPVSDSPKEFRKQRPDVKLKLDAANIEDALTEAAAQWHLPVDAVSEDLEATVLSSESAGFLGLFGKKTKKLHVEVRPKAPLLLLQGKHYLEELLQLMDLDVSIAVRVGGASESERVQDLDALDVIELDGADAEEFIVGRYGDVLKALEYLLNLSLRNPSVEPRVRIDSCGYRERRTRNLERLASATARQAVDYGRPIRLEPMLSWERWVIHMALKGRSDVRTESVGESPMRKVVVMPVFELDGSESSIDSGYSHPRVRSHAREHLPRSRLNSGSRFRSRFDSSFNDRDSSDDWDVSRESSRSGTRSGSRSGRRGSRRGK